MKKDKFQKMDSRKFQAPVFEQLKQIKETIPQLEGEILALKQQQLNQDYLLNEAKQIFKNWKKFLT